MRSARFLGALASCILCAVACGRVGYDEQPTRHESHDGGIGGDASGGQDGPDVALDAQILLDASWATLDSSLVVTCGSTTCSKGQYCCCTSCLNFNQGCPLVCPVLAP